MTSGEVVENTNRKCVDCEGYIDGKCGEDLQYPGGISCQNPQSTLNKLSIMRMDLHVSVPISESHKCIEKHRVFDDLISNHSLTQ